MIVITDRVVLDQQLQDTIYQFEHKHGVVQKIDENSRQLAEALENARADHHHHAAEVPLRLAAAAQDGRGARRERNGTLPTRRYAVIVDEAHSSQAGETATDLKEVLGGEELREEAEEARGRGRTRGHGRAVPQHGQARPAAEPELLRLHRHAEAQDARSVRPRTAKPPSTSTRCGRPSRRASSSTC